MSSFGVSGTNAHVVVEQAPVSAAVESVEPVVSTLVVSGKSPARIAATAGVLAQWMQTAGAEVPLSDVAKTLRDNRSRFKYTAAVCARDHAAAVAGLRALAAGESAAGVTEPRFRPAGTRPVFVFSGQGRIGWGWVVGCWPMSRCLPLRLMSWSRCLPVRWVFAAGGACSGS